MDSVRFMTRSLSSLADNLSDAPHKGKCKKCKSVFEYVTAKDSKLKFECGDGNKNNEFEID